MRTFLFIFFLTILTFSNCRSGKNNSNACNPNIRRSVKLMSDEKASLVDTIPIFTTIEEIGKIPVPKIRWETGRQDVEMKTYCVRCIVDTVERKLDGDYHLLLKSGDNYLIAEVPNPSCTFAQASKWNAAFLKVRTFIESNHLQGKEVEITGVAFVDVHHPYFRRQASNNIELHPIIKIGF